MPNLLPCLTKRTGCAVVLLLALVLTGCVTQKPLPFAYSAPRPAQAGAPSLALFPTQDQRNKKNNDGIDKVLDVPKCLDAVLLKELNNCGFLQKAEMKTNAAGTSQYVLQCTLNELAWEVPDYDRKLETAFTVSLLTGGIGGLAYGSTDTDVIGRAKMRFVVSTTDQTQVVLDQEYLGTVTEKKTKFSCDTPATYREVAAKAFRKVLDQFEAGFATAVLPP